MEWLRRAFGLDRAEIWTRMSRELGGRFVEGGHWRSDEVRVEHGPWVVVLDTFFNPASKTSHSRMRALCANPGDLRFSISRSGFLTELAKRFGLQDLEVGDPEFDREFLVRGNQSEAIRKLLSDRELRARLRAQPAVHFSLHPLAWGSRSGYPAGTCELAFLTGGLLRDIERAKELFELLAATLDLLGLPPAQPKPGQERS